MRGGLNEALDRMRRREEALRRRSAAPSTQETPQRHVAEEVAEALRAVVTAHPGTSVVARIEHDGQTYDLRVAWAGQEVAVSRQPATPPPAWPMSANTVPGWLDGQDGPEADSAARLAELIRRDPSLLTGEDPPG